MRVTLSRRAFVIGLAAATAAAPSIARALAAQTFDQAVIGFKARRLTCTIVGAMSEVLGQTDDVKAAVVDGDVLFEIGAMQALRYGEANRIEISRDGDEPAVFFWPLPKQWVVLGDTIWASVS